MNSFYQYKYIDIICNIHIEYIWWLYQIIIYNNNCGLASPADKIRLGIVGDSHTSNTKQNPLGSTNP